MIFNERFVLYLLLCIVIFFAQGILIGIFVLQPQSTLEAQIRDTEKAVMESFDFLKQEGESQNDVLAEIMYWTLSDPLGYTLHCPVENILHGVQAVICIILPFAFIDITFVDSFL